MLPIIGQPPPLRTSALSWRKLYEMGCFFQRELKTDSAVAGDARKRGFTLSQVGREVFELWDREGALRPVGFARAAYTSGMRGPALPSEYIVFRSEEPSYQPWEETYGWGRNDYPTVSALFTPWQLLLVPDR